MKIKTAEATGLALDWGVAVVETQSGVYHECGWDEADGVWVQHFGEDPVRFSHGVTSVWADLIEQYKPDVVYRAEEWGVEFPHNNNRFWSPSLARAVARCVISMKLGEVFEVPDDLGVVL